MVPLLVLMLVLQMGNMMDTVRVLVMGILMEMMTVAVEEQLYKFLYHDFFVRFYSDLSFQSLCH